MALRLLVCLQAVVPCVWGDGTPAWWSDSGWALAQCANSEGWLNLRVGYHNFDSTILEGLLRLGVSEICPKVAISFNFSRAALAVKTARRASTARTILHTMEKYTRSHLETLGIAPMLFDSWSQESAAIFFNMFQLVTELRLRAKALRRQPVFCNEDDLPNSQIHIRLLQDLLSSEELPVPKRIADRIVSTDDSLAISGQLPDPCSLTWSALNFAAANVIRLRSPLRPRHPSVEFFVRSAVGALKCWMSSHPKEGLLTTLASGCLPLLELMDRLDRPPIMFLDLVEAPLWSGKSFAVHILPTLNIESNLVRGRQELHCSRDIKKFAAERWRVARRPGQTFNMVEVGAHLGGCIFHFVTHLPTSRQEVKAVRALAVEPYEPAVSAMRRTIGANSLETIVEVSQSIICAKGQRFVHQKDRDINGPWLVQPGWISATDSSSASGEDDQPKVESSTKQCRGLGEVLQEHHFHHVDLLRVHVLGSEETVLRTVIPRLKSRRIKAVAVVLSSRNREKLRLARLLLDAGMTIECEGRRGSEALEHIAGIVKFGDTTLLAWHDVPDKLSANQSRGVCDVNCKHGTATATGSAELAASRF